MESRNPVFSRGKEFKRGGYATFDPRTPSAGELNDLYAAPSANAAQMGRMTLDDVVVRTASLFAVLLLAAVPTYALLSRTAGGFAVVVGSMLVALVLGLVISFSKTPKPALMLVYAAFEGVFVGGISRIYADFQDGIVAQAVVGTLAAFGSMLVLYKTGVIRNSPKFTKILIIAGVGYFAFGMLNLLLSAFHVGGYQSVYSGGGLLAVAVSAFGVVLASLYLVLDFDFIEQGVRNGLPRAYSWTAAFGLVVTLVWLYLEILRLISILRGND